MPCMELFSQQDELYKKRVLPSGQSIRIGIEAELSIWMVALGQRAKANKSAFIGMTTFSASSHLVAFNISALQVIVEKQQIFCNFNYQSLIFIGINWIRNSLR